MKSYISLLILYCLQKINDERTIYSIFHLLKGKKSSQTIQDAHLFKLKYLFFTFPQLSRTYFDETIDHLEKNELIYKIETEKYKMTDKGLIFLKEYIEKLPIPSRLNGWKYQSIQIDFWKRLSLLVQVCSNLIHYDSTYIPIHNDARVSEWLKMTIRKFGVNRSALAEQLLNEITSSLDSVSDINPEAFVLRLTGYKQIGLTQTQAAEVLNMDPFYFQLQFLNTIHFLIEDIFSLGSKAQILQNLLFDYQVPIILTKSASLTYNYLSSGHSLEEIAVVRNLKMSTIEDHAVEIALNDKDFRIEPFVTKEIQLQIEHSIQSLKTKQLKNIRQDLNEKISYFQIRLVLAKFGEQL